MVEMKNTVVNEDDLFVFANNDTKESERIVAPRYSYWKSVFRVFFQKKGNWFLLGLLALLLLASYILPMILRYSPMENVDKAALYNLSPKDAMAQLGGGLKYILGTGPMGNSIFYGIWASSRTSLTLAIICAAINMALGILIGAVWGYSKAVDTVMLQVYNIIANVPYILVITVLVYVIGSGFWSFVFALTITGWLGIAYFFRTQVLIIRDREYSLASRCLGTPTSRIVGKNILPFMTSVIVTQLATELPSYISMEVFLSFIGVGLPAETPSLGRMIQQAQTSFLAYPWEFWPPVFISALLTILLFLIGQNFADASDPRTHM